MRRLSIVLVLAALCLPVSAQAATRVSAFYYPWYATSAHDGSYQHWSQRGHAPPNDIASAFYPARGLYSSADRLVIGEQMDELHVAGVDEVAVSWWGRGSAEDARLPAVLAAARTSGITVAAHLEPYSGRTVASVMEARRRIDDALSVDLVGVEQVADQRVVIVLLHVRGDDRPGLDR